MNEQPNFDGDSSSPERAPDPIETLVKPLWRSRWWILALGIVGVGVGAFKSAILINTFDSAGKLLVRTGARESATPETFVVSGGSGGQINARESMANEIHLLRDPSVFRRVVAIVGPGKILAPYDPSASDGPNTPFIEGTLHRFQSYWSTRGTAGLEADTHLPDDCTDCTALAGEIVARGVSIYPEPGSSVVSVTYSAHTPQLAADVTNAYLKAAIDHHRDFFRGGQELELIEARLSEARDALNRVESAIGAFHNECGVYDIEGQSSAVVAELASLQAMVTEEHAKELGMRALKAFLDQSVANEPAKLATTTEQSRLVNPQHSFLMQEKMRLELQPIGDAGGSVQKLETLQAQRAEQIARVQAALDKEPEFIAMQPLRQLANNPEFQRLVQQRGEVEGNLLALEQSQAVRQARIADLHEERSHLMSCRGQSSALDQEYGTAKQRLEQCTLAHEKAKLLSSLDQSELTNLLVLQAANVPRTKSGPQRGRMLLIGGVLGAAAGGALGFLLQKLDRRVRRASDIEGLVGVPVLELVPEAKLARRKQVLSP